MDASWENKQLKIGKKLADFADEIISESGGMEFAFKLQAKVQKVTLAREWKTLSRCQSCIIAENGSGEEQRPSPTHILGFCAQMFSCPYDVSPAFRLISLRPSYFEYMKKKSLL